MAEASREQRCLIITPSDGERANLSESLDGLMLSVIEPTLLEVGFRKTNISVTHQMYEGGVINHQIMTRILNDVLCVANITGLNPFVMYELAVRHSVGKPVITIAEEGTKLPYEMMDQRTIFYQNTMLGAVKFKKSFKDMVISILQSPNKTLDNPILNMVKEKSILKNINTIEEDENELNSILRKVYEIDQKLTRLLD